MGTLKEAAQAYVPPTTLNVADLERVPVDIEIKEETHKNKDGEEFTINVIEIDKNKYRIPSSVLNGMKAILQKVPNTKFISVIKSGSGLNTSYQVIPVDAATKISEEKIVG